MVHPDMKALSEIATEPIAMVDADKRSEVENLVMKLKKDGDSTGGIVEVVATGLPIGLGNPNFDGIENRLARVIFGVPAIKGVSFGGGFDMCSRLGSEVNDAFTMDGDTITTTTNIAVAFKAVSPTAYPSLCKWALSLLRPFIRNNILCRFHKKRTYYSPSKVVTTHV